MSQLLELSYTGNSIFQPKSISRNISAPAAQEQKSSTAEQTEVECRVASWHSRGAHKEAAGKDKGQQHRRTAARRSEASGQKDSAR